LKVAIIRHSEITPLDSQNVRLLRSGSLATYLADKDIDVTWYISTFNHFTKKQRGDNDFVIKQSDNLLIHYVKTIGYKKNKSLRRIVDHVLFGYHVFRLLQDTHYDVVISSFPTITSTFLALYHCRKRNIPFVLDFRDMWPSVFWQQATGIKKVWIKVLCLPAILMTRYALSYTNVILAPTSQYLNYAQNYVNRTKSDLDSVSPLGYKFESYSLCDSVVATLNKQARGRKIICFAGTIGDMFDFESLLVAAERLVSSHLFVFCGEGSKLANYRTRTAALDSVLWLGWLDKKELHTVFKQADMALAPYRNIDNFKLHTPNKFSEYLAYNLPIVSCLSGDSEKIVAISGGDMYLENNPQSLVRTISKLDQISDISVSANKAGAQQYFIANLDSDQIFSKVHSLILSLVK
jgi:hypothetical protein